MRIGGRWYIATVLVCTAVWQTYAGGAEKSIESKFYGEPVQLRGKHIYFTSWKYVRQGNFAWRVEHDPGATEAEKLQGAWLKGDSSKPARFETTDMPRGIRLVAQKAEKVPFKPGQMAATMFEDGKYKAWYTVPPCTQPESLTNKDKMMPGHASHLAYAESKDAITWEKPNLGLFECAGNRNNNIVMRTDLDGSIRGIGGIVFLDPSSKEERYKILYMGGITDEEWAAFEKKYPGEADTMARRPDVGGFRCVSGVFGAVSADGIHWKLLPEPLMIQHADTVNTCYWDVDLKKYVAYVRAWQVNERVPGLLPDNSDVWIGVGRRSIGRAVSDDFRHFTKAEVVVSTGADMPPSHVWYTNGKTTLPDCPDNHVMFPWLWELENDGGSTWLLSSADGWTWSRVPGGPVIEPGPLGGPDGAFVTCSGNLLEYPGDKWGMPFSGTPIPHKYPGRDITQRKGLFPGVAGVAGLAMWPKGRLVALQCDDEGQFATVAVVPPGENIRLNASARPTGYIKVAIRLFGSGDDLPGRSFEDTDRMIGDSLAMPVSWKGETALKHGGKPVILRFQLKQAKLFGIEFY